MNGRLTSIQVYLDFIDFLVQTKDVFVVFLWLERMNKYPFHRLFLFEILGP